MLTYEELSNALKRMKNNKSPGSDGFSVECFKYFWKDIGFFVLKSTNYAFIIGELSVTQITCIPIGDTPQKRRPISLSNVYL